MEKTEEYSSRQVRDADASKGEAKLHVPNTTHVLNNGLSTGSNPSSVSTSASILAGRTSTSPAPSGPTVHLGVHLQPDLNDGNQHFDAAAQHYARLGQCLNSLTLADGSNFQDPQSTHSLQEKQPACSTEVTGLGSDIWSVQNGAPWGGMQHASTAPTTQERNSSPLGLGSVRNIPTTYLSDSVLGDLSTNLADEEVLLSQLTGGNGGSSNISTFNIDSAQQHLLQVQQQQQMQQQAMLLQKLAAGRSQQVRLTSQQAQQQAQALALATSLLMGQGADAGAGSSGQGVPVDPGPGSGALLSSSSGGAPSVGGSASLYVKNLPPEADELLLYRTFSPLGALLSCKVHTDPATGRCRGVGFVNFADQASAVRALQQLHGTRIADGRVMHITLQAPRAVRAAAAAANAAGAARPTMAPTNNHNSQFAAFLAAANPTVDSHPSAWSVNSGGGGMNTSQAMLALAGASAKRQQTSGLNAFPNSFGGLPGAHINHGGFLSDITSPSRAQGLDPQSQPSVSNLGNMSNMGNMGMVFL